MADIKTKLNDKDVMAYLESVEDTKRRQDALALVNLMREATGAEPHMWGENIIGFGSHRYKYDSGREMDWFLSGFAPRKPHLVLYIMGGGFDRTPLLEKLGKYKTGKGCLYVKKLEDVNLNTLKDLIQQSAEHVLKSSAD